MYKLNYFNFKNKQNKYLLTNDVGEYIFLEKEDFAKLIKKEELKNKITEYKDYLSEQKDIARKSFKCISIEYYNDTGRIKYMEFTEK